jgi:signal peptidase I
MRAGFDGTVRRVARTVLVLAVRGRRARGSAWGEAVLAEFDETTGAWQAVRWAAGGVRVALRERAGLRSHRARLGRRLAVTAVVVALATVAVNQLLLTPRYMPSSSMAPTIRAGERVLVDRASYRLTGLHYGDLLVLDVRDPAPLPVIPATPSSAAGAGSTAMAPR